MLDFTDLEDESQDLREAAAPASAAAEARANIASVWNAILSWLQSL